MLYSNGENGYEVSGNWRFTNLTSFGFTRTCLEYEVIQTLNKNKNKIYIIFYIITILTVIGTQARKRVGHRCCEVYLVRGYNLGLCGLTGPYRGVATLM